MLNALVPSRSCSLNGENPVFKRVERLPSREKLNALECLFKEYKDLWYKGIRIHEDRFLEFQRNM